MGSYPARWGFTRRDQAPVIRVDNKCHGLSVISTVTHKGQMRWRIFDGTLNVPTPPARDPQELQNGPVQQLLERVVQTPKLAPSRRTSPAPLRRSVTPQRQRPDRSHSLVRQHARPCSTWPKALRRMAERKGSIFKLPSIRRLCFLVVDRIRMPESKSSQPCSTKLDGCSTDP